MRIRSIWFIGWFNKIVILRKFDWELCRQSKWVVKIKCQIWSLIIVQIVQVLNHMATNYSIFVSSLEPSSIFDFVYLFWIVVVVVNLPFNLASISSIFRFWICRLTAHVRRNVVRIHCKRLKSTSTIVFKTISAFKNSASFLWRCDSMGTVPVTRLSYCR